MAVRGSFLKRDGDQCRGPFRCCALALACAEFIFQLRAQPDELHDHEEVVALAVFFLQQYQETGFCFCRSLCCLAVLELLMRREWFDWIELVKGRCLVRT